MNSFKHRLVLIAFFSVTVTSVLWATDVSTNTPSEVLVEENGFKVSYEDGLQMLVDIEPIQLQRLANNSSKVDKLLLQLLAHKKKVRMARKLGLDKDIKVQRKIEFATNNILVKALARDALSKISLPENGFDEVAEAFYNANPEKYKVKAKVSVAHILFRIKDKDDDVVKKAKYNEAKNVLKKVKDGYDFKLAAKQHSDEKTTASKGGYLGFFGYGEMVPEFEKVAFSLTNVGEISDIVETQFGYHIIKLLDKVPPSIKPFRLVKSELIQIEENKYTKYKLEEYLMSFKASDKTTLNSAVVEKFKRAINEMIK